MVALTDWKNRIKENIKLVHVQGKQLTREQAFQKLKHYCAYQERCHQEVRDKAYSFGLRKHEVEELISNLIQEDYLNEERFAIQYAGGKFRMKQWGKAKIINELRRKNISSYCIHKAMKSIPGTDYNAALTKLADKKWRSITGPGVNKFVKMSKTRNYLLQKGYEVEEVAKAIGKLV